MQPRLLSSREWYVQETIIWKNAIGRCPCTEDPFMTDTEVKSLIPYLVLVLFVVASALVVAVAVQTTTEVLSNQSIIGGGCNTARGGIAFICQDHYAAAHQVVVAQVGAAGEWVPVINGIQVRELPVPRQLGRHAFIFVRRIYTFLWLLLEIKTHTFFLLLSRLFFSTPSLLRGHCESC